MLRTPERCHPLPCAALLTLLSLGPLSTPTVAAPKSAKAPSAQALVQRAGAAYREGRHLEAARAFEEAYQFGADPLLLVRAAAAYRAAGDLASAQRALERRQASSQGTALAEVRQQLAEVQALQSGAQAQRLAQAGEPLGAVGVLRVALRDQPLPPLQLALARAYQQSGATAEALEGYRSYLQQGAKEPAALRLEVQTTVGTLSELLRTRGELHRLKNPPFYRKPWFAAVCAVGGIALGAGVTTVVLLTRVSPEPTTELGIKGVNLP